MDKLKLLENQIKYDLDAIRYPEAEWVIPRRYPGIIKIYDVIIIGAGQGGLAAAFGLKKEGISNILILEKNKKGFEGPWLDYARMHTLRTPKHFNGPDLDIPSLTCQSWYEANYGLEAWHTIKKIPKEHWQEYLQWFRHVLDLPVMNEVFVKNISPRRRFFKIKTIIEGKIIYFYSRKIILATGIEGNGIQYIPDFIEHLPKHYYSHAAEYIDFSLLKNKKIAVIGGGASAYDNAATALELGAKEVHLFKRSKLHRVNLHKWTEFNGFLNHFCILEDKWRWSIMKYILSLREPPPPETFKRAIKHSNFYLKLDNPIQKVDIQKNKINISSKKGNDCFDYIILSTGFVVDLTQRYELKEFVKNIALWKDRFKILDDEQKNTLGQFPYLGPHFEFVEIKHGAAPFLKNIYNFTSGATLSHGPSGSSINGMKHAVKRLVSGISRDFFLEDIKQHYHNLRSFDLPEMNIPWPPKTKENL